jgi:ribosome modulation factor
MDVVTRQSENGKQSAFGIGYDDGMDGYGIEDCPYEIEAFATAWKNGWRKADSECKEIFAKNAGKQVGYG